MSPLGYFLDSVGRVHRPVLRILTTTALDGSAIRDQADECGSCGQAWPCETARNEPDETREGHS